MMKVGKLLLLTLLLLSVFLSGCNYQEIINDVKNPGFEQSPIGTPATKPAEPFIGFSETDAQSLEDLQQVKQEELQNYTSRYSDYNSYHYFEHLNEAEQLLYHAYEYALDGALSCFWIDEQLLQNMERSAIEVLEFLALDSAMVGQNYRHRQGEATMTYSGGTTPTETTTYVVILVDNFEREELQRKEEAIEKARKIVSEAPEAATERELAEYFYDYLGNNVTYEKEIEGLEYLYTALCEQRTNCDGYTNSFALLCSMADIPCIEINSDTPEDEIGHTWNAIYLEDRWVQVDCTVATDDVNSECKNCREERPYFGFPDALLRYPMEHEEIVPDCPEGLSPVLKLSSGKVDGFNSKVKAEFEANDGKFAVVLLDEGDLEQQINDAFVRELGFGLYYLHYETAEGKMVYYLFNDNE